MFDEVDFNIIELLKKNSKMQFREIGEKVHLTGQAVSNRISKMEREGLIKGYTIVIDESKLDENIEVYITVFMKTIKHKEFCELVKNNKFVIEAHKISGEGCYILKAKFPNNEALKVLLDDISDYGTYIINISIDKIK